MIKYLFFFISCAVISFIIQSLFFEFVPNFFNYILFLIEKREYDEAFRVFYTHFLKNFYTILSFNEGPIYIFMKYSYLMLMVYFTIKSILEKKRLYIAISLLFYVNVFLLLLFYDAYGWREIRALAPLYFFSCLFISLDLKIHMKYFVLIILIPFLSLTAFEDSWLKERHRHNKKLIYEKRTYLKKALSDINKNNNTILIDFPLTDKSMDLLTLPVKTKNDIPIKYIAPYYPVIKNPYFFVLRKKGNELYIEKSMNN